MIETRVPKDIRTVKANVLGPLSMRQTVCLTIAVITDIVLYVTIKSTFNMDISFFVFILFAIDVGIFSFTFEPKGMKMEKYLKNIVLRNFLEPQKKKNITMKYVIQGVKKNDEEISNKKSGKKSRFKIYR